MLPSPAGTRKPRVRGCALSCPHPRTVTAVVLEPVESAPEMRSGEWEGKHLASVDCIVSLLSWPTAVLAFGGPGPEGPPGRGAAVAPVQSAPA